MKPFLSIASLVLGFGIDAEATSTPTSAPSAPIAFCGFPTDIFPDPFAEPLEICNGLANTEEICEASLFYSSYECFWDDGRCTSNADLTGEDTTCPPILNQTACEDEDPWIGPRKCIWWAPTASPSSNPSLLPTSAPTGAPSLAPSPGPSPEPTAQPSSTPSATPSYEPSRQPSLSPSRAPTSMPSRFPSAFPSISPTLAPSAHPSPEPSSRPTGVPSDEPSKSPSITPTGNPSSSPSTAPSSRISFSPTVNPSLYPSGFPSVEPSESPTTKLTVKPSATPSQELSTSPSVSPSKAPSGQPSLASSLRPSIMPSLVPSSYPTKVKVGDDTPPPSISLAPSSAPSKVPTDFPTRVNTFPPVLLNPDKFSWNIERLGPAIVAFNDASDQEEIMLDYNISLRENTVVIYEENCKTPVPSSVIGVHKVLTPNTTHHGTLAVDLDIKQAMITSSPVWTDGNVGVGYIDICIRVDLMLVDGTNPPTSVNFHETKLALTIDLTQNFQMTIDLNRTDADALAQDTAVNYTVIACQCDADANCVKDTALPGYEVLFCLWTTSPDIKFVAIQELDFTQNSLKWHPILDGVEDDLTAVTVNGDKCVVRTQMASVFFAEDNPADVLVEGVALLAFADTTLPKSDSSNTIGGSNGDVTEGGNGGSSSDDSSNVGGGRRVRYLHSNIFTRRIQEIDGKGIAPFRVDVGLGSAESSSASCKGIASAAAVLAGSVFFLL